MNRTNIQLQSLLLRITWLQSIRAINAQFADANQTQQTKPMVRKTKVNFSSTDWLNVKQGLVGYCRAVQKIAEFHYSA